MGPTLGVRLRFAAQVGIVDPTPNPLGTNFGSLAGYVSIFNDASGNFQMIGAVQVNFTPDTLKQYGIDVHATVFLQINTTTTAQDVTLEYLDGTLTTVTIRAQSFSLYLKGDIKVGAPGSDPADAFFKMNGFVILEIDLERPDAGVRRGRAAGPRRHHLARVDGEGLPCGSTAMASRRGLDLTLVTNFPSSSGLVLSANFLLIINTTGKRVTYDVPAAFLLTGAPGQQGHIVHCPGRARPRAPHHRGLHRRGRRRRQGPHGSECGPRSRPDLLHHCRHG